MYNPSMGAAPSLRRREPIPIDSHALDNLRFIRETMESAGSFTAVPGVGGAMMGVAALLAAPLAARQSTVEGWLGVWMAAAVLAFTIGALAMVRKAKRAGVPLISGPARKFALSLLPPMLVGGLLTFGL